MIVALIGVWAWLVTTIMEALGTMPFAVTMILYGLAGIVWIVPARPLLVWMETGRFR